MTRDLICKRCFVKIGEENAVKTNSPKKTKLCQLCKKESLQKQKKILETRNKSEELRNKNSNRMKLSNPMYDRDVRDKVSKTMKTMYNNGDLKSPFSDPEKLKEIRSKWKISEAGRESISISMKIHNPMMDDSIKNKMMKTFRDKVASGEIVYKKGKEHHLWKGNRGFCDTLRVQLYPVWTKKCLERDGFKCTVCGVTSNLTVHHIKPLRDYISDTLIKYDIDSFDSISPNDWQLYFDEIISNHKLHDGVTLCKKCHKKIDRYYNYRETDEN